MKPVSKADFQSEGRQQLHFLNRVCPLPEIFGEDNPDSEYRMIWAYEVLIEDDNGISKSKAHRHEYDVADFIHNHNRQHAASDTSVFYAPALFSNKDWEMATNGYYAERNDRKPGRNTKSVRYLKSFWIDIDGDDDCPTPESIRQKINEFSDSTGMLDNNIEFMEVRSGAGIHMYLPLTEPVPVNEWQPVADALHSFAVTKLNADKITKNGAGLLRLPCTMNRKRADNGAYKYGDGGKEVVWLTDVSEPNQLDDIRKWLTANGFAPGAAQQVHFAHAKPKEQPKIDDAGLRKMLKGCAVMQKITSTDSEHSDYYDWYHTLGLVTKSDNPESTIRTLMPEKTARMDAKRGSGWVAEQIDSRIRNGYAPVKCEQYAEKNPDACKGCVLAGKKWGSPVKLAVNPYDKCNDVEKGFIDRMDAWFKGVNANYNTLFDDDVPLILPRIFQALNKCYMDNKDNNLIFVRPHGTQHRIKDNKVDRPTLLQDLKVGGGQFHRKVDEFVESHMFPPGTDFEKVTIPQFEKEKNRFKTGVLDAINGAFWSERNATKVDLCIDMFAEESELKMVGRGNECKITLPFAGFLDVPELPGSLTDDDVAAIVDDYKDHFPQFDEFIDFVCHSRFADTRRFSFLWLVCPSDWGKSFLLNLFGVTGLDLVYDAKTDTIKDMTKGTTSGLTTDGLADKWIMFFDEASGAPKEIKDLNDFVVFTPKYGSQTKAPLYAKIFACTNLPSTLTEFGIEPQFENRCSLIRIPKDAVTLTERELFQHHGEAYRKVLLHYLRNRIRKFIDDARKNGRDDAGNHARKYIADFRDRHPISIEGAMEETIQDIVESMMMEMLTAVNSEKNYWGVGDPDPRPIIRFEQGHHQNIGYATINGEKFVKIRDIRSWIKEHVAGMKKGDISVKLDKSIDDISHTFETVLRANGALNLRPRHKVCNVVEGQHVVREVQQRGWFVPYVVAGTRMFPESINNISFPWRPATEKTEPETEAEVEDVPKPKTKADKMKDINKSQTAA